MMVCATSSTIRNPAPPRPLLLSMAITAASRPARRRSAPTSVVALDRQKARLGYAGNTHRQPTQPDRGPARRLIWPAKPGQLPFSFDSRSGRKRLDTWIGDLELAVGGLCG